MGCFYVLNIGLRFELSCWRVQSNSRRFYVLNIGLRFEREKKPSHWYTENVRLYVLNIGLRFEPYPFFGLSQQRF